MSAGLDRLKNVVSMKAQRRVVTLPDGSEFEMWTTPPTIAERDRARAQAGDNASAANYALQLLIMKACDENGQKLFAPGDAAVLRNEYDADMLESLMIGMNKSPEDEVAPDPKSSGASSAKTAR